MLDCCFQLLLVVACYLLCIISSIMFLDQSTIKLNSRAKGPIIVVPLLSHTNLPLVAYCCSYCVYRCFLSLHKSTWVLENEIIMLTRIA
jgi:hypothetical protein